MKNVNDKLNIKYGIIVCFPDKPNDIMHFCGYEDPISINDVKSLTMELLTDKEFSPIDEYMNELIFRKATPKEIEWVNSTI